MIRMDSGNLGFTCKLGIVPMNRFSLNIYDFISCCLPFQEPPNIYIYISVPPSSCTWPNGDRRKNPVSMKAAFEYVTNSCL